MPLFSFFNRHRRRAGSLEWRVRQYVARHPNHRWDVHRLAQLLGETDIERLLPVLKVLLDEKTLVSKYVVASEGGRGHTLAEYDTLDEVPEEIDSPESPEPIPVTMSMIRVVFGAGDARR